MHRGDGFTLTEVLLTVVVIGIIASIAIPSYQRTFEHAIGRESETSLRIIYQAEQAYYYSKSPPNNLYGNYPNDLNSYIPNNLNSNEWTYTVTLNNGGTPKSFTATATRQQGPHANQTRTIDQTGTLNPTTWPPD